MNRITLDRSRTKTFEYAFKEFTHVFAKNNAIRNCKRERESVYSTLKDLMRFTAIIKANVSFTKS